MLSSKRPIPRIIKRTVLKSTPWLQIKEHIEASFPKYRFITTTEPTYMYMHYLISLQSREELISTVSADGGLEPGFMGNAPAEFVGAPP